MKKALVVGFIGVIALVAAAYAFSNSGQAGHQRFPTHAGKVEKLEDGVVMLGFGGIRSFKWHVYVEQGRHGGPPCFEVGVVGPLHRFPDGKLGGPSYSETKCGLSARHGQVVTEPMREGESSPPFDIGIAAYKTPVSRVRLAVSGGEEAFGTRRLPRDFGLSRVGSLRYAVFAVEGCARKIFGLEKGRVVATAGDWECEAE
jgi:hypothetical protein